MCTLPTDTAGYVVTSCDTTRSGAMDAASCDLGAACASGYNGAPAETCDTNNGEFALSGCQA